MHSHVSMYMYVCRPRYVCVCMYVYVCMCMYVCIHVGMYVGINGVCVCVWGGGSERKMCMFVYLYDVYTMCECVVWTCHSACMFEYCLRFLFIFI